MVTAALVGNPNCGKTTLFNSLTGSTQHVGNWPGVTVEKKEGSARIKGEELRVVDLPGIYALSPYSLEEQVTRRFLLSGEVNGIINIVDATNLERSLSLTLTLMEVGLPMVVALNMMDEVEARGERIDVGYLEKKLGVPIVPIVARKEKNIEALLQSLLTQVKRQSLPMVPSYGEKLGYWHRRLAAAIEGYVGDEKGAFYASCFLETGDCPEAPLRDTQRKKVQALTKDYLKEMRQPSGEMILIEARFRYLDGFLSRIIQKGKGKKHLLSKGLDRIFTNRFLAFPIFFCILFFIFSITFGPVGNALKGGVEQFLDGTIRPLLEGLLHRVYAPEWLTALMLDGVLTGVGGVLSFLPQIMLLFFFLSVLEDTGYMARAAFIMDKPLQKIGLSGKSFIPMLMGFGCTTPAIMAARTMAGEKERRQTILLLPFLSCGARMPVYVLFAGTFFPKEQSAVIFGLYLLGILLAIGSGVLFQKTLFRGEAPPFLLELPPYRLPSLKNSLLHMWNKAEGFLVKAGTLIFSMSILVWICQHFDFSLALAEEPNSMLGVLGHAMAPLFAPLGFGFWQAGVALLAGLVAKEAVVSTLAVLFHTGGGLALGVALGQCFTPAAALSFMVFVLLYIPCVAAMATMRKELGSIKWMAFSCLWQIAVAYGAAFLCYRAALLFF